MQRYLISMKQRIRSFLRQWHPSPQPGAVRSKTTRSVARALAAAGLIAAAPLHLSAQLPLYDADFKPVNFDFDNATRTVGSSSLAEGAVHLYESVITIETGPGVSQEIDAIVRTVKLEGKRLTTYDATSQSNVANNSDTNWFMPLFDSATGYGLFQFEFIEHGSYDSATHTGSPVTLQNVYVNSFDIDGTGSGGTNSVHRVWRIRPKRVERGNGLGRFLQS